jgi:CelD/BcsL family acetyltransferase involved in cellulose biosynthesis
VSAHRGDLEILDRFADEWRDLCAQAVDDQPFFRPEWISAYLRAFMPTANVLLITARLEGRLSLVLPMVEENQVFNGVPVRKLRSPVNAHGVRFDAARTPGPDGDAAISDVWEFLREMEGWDVLEFAHTPEGSMIDRLVANAHAGGFRTACVAERLNPYVPIPDDPELLKKLPRNSRLRTQLRQVHRLTAEQGPLTFYRVQTADRGALDRFYQLEASGWKGGEGSAILCDSKTRQFYDEVAASAARFGYFSLYLLELRGELIAAHFALIHQGRCYSPKVAYSENYRQFAPGHLIVSEILKDCCARGIYGFDITGPNDEWKMKWTSDTRAVNHHFVFRNDLAGSLAYAVRFRLRPAVARLLPRRLKTFVSQ